MRNLLASLLTLAALAIVPIVSPTPAVAQQTEQVQQSTSQPIETHVRIDRLERLADYVQKLDRQDLNQHQWSDKVGYPNYGKCALGHATDLFASEGLHPDFQFNGVPVYAGRKGELAGVVFFGITPEESMSLFSGDEQRYGPGDPKSVAKRIRTVANRERDRLAKVELAEAEKRREQTENKLEQVETRVRVAMIPISVQAPVVVHQDPVVVHQALLVAHQPETRIRVDRLERLADYIEPMDPRAVNMHHWTYQDEPGRESSGKCAMGHAADLFASEGLYPDFENNMKGTPSYGEYRGISAGAAFFGLSNEDAYQLFNGDVRKGQADPVSIARRIRSVASRERSRIARAEVRKLCELAAAW